VVDVPAELEERRVRWRYLAERGDIFLGSGAAAAAAAEQAARARNGRGYGAVAGGGGAGGGGGPAVVDGAGVGVGHIGGGALPGVCPPNDPGMDKHEVAAYYIK
jgi:hypothetical protein